MTTVQDIHDALPVPSSFTTTLTVSETLKALKRATRNAWPTAVIEEYQASVGTFTTGTFVYDISTTITTLFDPPLIRVYAAPQDTSKEPEINIHGFRVREDNKGDVYLVFDAGVVSTHANKAFHLAWQRPPTVPTLSTSTLEISDEYAEAYAMLHYVELELWSNKLDLRQMEGIEARWNEKLEMATKRMWCKRWQPARYAPQDRMN